MASASDIVVPDTFDQRLEKHFQQRGEAIHHPDNPGIWDRQYNEDLKKKLLWAAPYDARFPQIRKQRQCFTYYVDFFRCRELMGEDYKPCQFFQNVYNDFCPSYWVEKWDEWREAGRFPARFDR